MQKTAYEMHISDWSSDVGSSDLARALHPLVHASEVPVARNALERRRIVEARNMAVRLAERPPQIRTDAVGAALVDRVTSGAFREHGFALGRIGGCDQVGKRHGRFAAPRAGFRVLTRTGRTSVRE